MIPMDFHNLNKLSETVQQRISKLEAAMKGLSIEEPLQKAYEHYLRLISANIKTMQLLSSEGSPPLHLPQETAQITHTLVTKHILSTTPIGDGQFGSSIKRVAHADGTCYVAKTPTPSEVLIHYLLPPHDNIIKFLGVNTDQELLIEYIPRGDLFLNGLERKVFNEKEIKSIAEQIALGLKHLHNHRIIHCDLKPDNILINEKNVIKISDFGLSRTVFDEETSFVGTPEYAAPEVLLSLTKDHKIDVWSYACILFALMHPYPFGDEILHQLKYPQEICDNPNIENLSKPFKEQSEDVLTKTIEQVISLIKTSDLLPILKVCFAVNPKTRFSIEEVLPLFHNTEPS